MKFFKIYIILIIVLQILNIKGDDEPTGNERKEFYVEHVSTLSASGENLTVTLFNLIPDNTRYVPTITIVDSNNNSKDVYGWLSYNRISHNIITKYEAKFDLPRACGIQEFYITIGNQTCKSKIEFILPKVFNCASSVHLDYEREYGYCDVEGVIPYIGYLDLTISNKSIKNYFQKKNRLVIEDIPTECEGGLLTVSLCNVILGTFDIEPVLQVQPFYHFSRTPNIYSSLMLNSNGGNVTIPGYLFNKKTAENTYISCEINKTNNNEIQMISNYTSNTQYNCTYENSELINCYVNENGPDDIKCNLHFNQGGKTYQVINITITFRPPVILNVTIQYHYKYGILTIIGREFYDLKNFSVHVGSEKCIDFKHNSNIGGIGVIKCKFRLPTIRKVESSYKLQKNQTVEYLEVKIGGKSTSKHFVFNYYHDSIFKNILKIGNPFPFYFIDDNYDLSSFGGNSIYKINNFISCFILFSIIIIIILF